VIREKKHRKKDLHLALAVVYNATISPEIGRDVVCPQIPKKSIFFDLRAQRVLPPGASYSLDVSF
jgi:hypothetical protein